MKFILALPHNISSLAGIALELSSLFNNVHFLGYITVITLPIDKMYTTVI